jgi:2-polyprenyl-3-methyl-5-hydroxy-6-metoxy-1,4-benzoquinol methylase
MGNIAIFDSAAKQYDTPERVEIAAAIADKIRAHIGGAAKKSAIDYGCGTGLVGLRLLDVFSSVLFVDASENMISVVREKIKRGDVPNAAALCADIMANAPPLAADCILLIQVLLHEKDTRSLLSRLRAALNEGGRLLIVDFDRNENVSSPDIHSGFGQSELAGTLTLSGYDVNYADTFYWREKMFMAQDASLFLLDAVKR